MLWKIAFHYKFIQEKIEIIAVPLPGNLKKEMFSPEMLHCTSEQEKMTITENFTAALNHCPPFIQVVGRKLEIGI